MKKTNLKINGKVFKEEIKDNTLLVDFLRENLKLTGTHVGCDTSQCGACNILLNGEAVKSCTIFVLDIEGSEVTTIEGVSNDDGSLNFVQKAFQKNHGLQCGFCTPGMIITVLDLLRKNKDPDDDEIKKQLSGNLCRCTGYNNIVKSVAEVARNIKKFEREKNNV